MDGWQLEEHSASLYLHHYCTVHYNMTALLETINIFYVKVMPLLLSRSLAVPTSYSVVSQSLPCMLPREMLSGEVDKSLR